MGLNPDPVVGTEFAAHDWTTPVNPSVKWVGGAGRQSSGYALNLALGQEDSLQVMPST